MANIITQEIQKIILKNSYDGMLTITSEQLAEAIRVALNQAFIKEVFSDQVLAKSLEQYSGATGLRLFWEQCSEWSQKTFGPDDIRGPKGPLLHLQKEVVEVLAKANDLHEYADCLFLVFDACRRAGFNYHQLLQAVWDKLEINKQRTWPDWKKVDLELPVEHVPDEADINRMDSDKG